MSQITATGCLFYAKSTKRFLFLNRSIKQKGTWGMVGGKSVATETPWQGLQREIIEEVGHLPTIQKTIPLELFVSKDTRFKFHTFVCVVEQEFSPRLNAEHSGYAWVSINCWPLPLHDGVRKTLQNKTIKTKLQTILDLIV
jgi:8-oxo-dGTP pyrophosphatase MutT (NUDIX family)|tara:strand:- start:233 stop:655 length:423 start_codon:yes stop_codon:yes gene_type:complete